MVKFVRFIFRIISMVEIWRRFSVNLKTLRHLKNVLRESLTFKHFQHLSLINAANINYLTESNLIISLDITVASIVNKALQLILMISMALRTWCKCPTNGFWFLPIPNSSTLKSLKQMIYRRFITSLNLSPPINFNKNTGRHRNAQHTHHTLNNSDSHKVKIKSGNKNGVIKSAKWYAHDEWNPLENKF